MSTIEQLIKDVPADFQSVFTEIVRLTDAFCDTHLNAEYRELCREMAVAVCQEGSPVKEGKPLGWAAGIVHCVGKVNFLSDPSQQPSMKYADLAKAMGVSMSAMAAKSRVIWEGLDLMQLHPDWCLPSRLADNPLVWMLKVNGVIMDIRMAPREAQVEAYRRGLIPFVPVDQEQPKPPTT
jgi:hypothetical protein